MRVTKIDTDICGYGEVLMSRHLCSTIPSQEFVEFLWKLSGLFDQGCHHALGVFVRDFGQHHKTGMALHKRDNIAVVRPRDQIALPPHGHTMYALPAMMTRNGTIFYLCWEFANLNSVLDFA